MTESAAKVCWQKHAEDQLQRRNMVWTYTQRKTDLRPPTVSKLRLLTIQLSWVWGGNFPSPLHIVPQQRLIPWVAVFSVQCFWGTCQQEEGVTVNKDDRCPRPVTLLSALSCWTVYSCSTESWKRFVWPPMPTDFASATCSISTLNWTQACITPHTNYHCCLFKRNVNCGNILKCTEKYISHNL